MSAIRSPRYVIVGAGAVGAVIGGRLHEHGRDVVLVARGANLEVLRRDGLCIVCPQSEVTLKVPVVGDLGSAKIANSDVVILAVKTQDSSDVIDELTRVAPRDVSIVCAQNGVETERLALRHFANVFGAYNFLISTFTTPGLVRVHTAPYSGVFDVGRYPGSTSGAAPTVDALAEIMANDLRESAFDSVARPDIMRWKYAKLLTNVMNAFQAICTDLAGVGDLLAMARREGKACLIANNIDAVPQMEEEQRRHHLLPLQAAGGVESSGGSTWQSLARGTGRIEADYLNGEVTLLGRLAGVPTPVNDAIGRLVTSAARQHQRPGTMTPDELRAALDLTSL